METVYNITRKGLASMEITPDLAAVHMAMEPLTNPQDYAPAIYAPCPPMLTQYANDRRNDLVPRSKEMAIANGNWLFEIRRAREKNSITRTILNDDIKTLRDAGNTDGVEKILRIMKRLADNEHCYDANKYLMHSEVQAKDVRERMIVDGH